MITHDDDEGDEGEGESVDSEAYEGPIIYKEVVDDQHTIENVGHVSMQVNSHARAMELLVRHLAASACSWLLFFVYQHRDPLILSSLPFPGTGRGRLRFRLSIS